MMRLMMRWRKKLVKKEKVWFFIGESDFLIFSLLMSILKRTLFPFFLMKNFKFLKYTFTLVWLFIFWIFNYLFANNEYYYKNLTVNSDIQQDWTIQVNEIFDAYFNVYKHGIIRNIPLKYTIDGKKFRIFLENIRV